MGEKIFGFIEYCFFIPILIIAFLINILKEYSSDKFPT